MGGAAIGALIDKKGPGMAKKILEGVSAIKGIPTIQKISKLDIPEDAKQLLIDDFIFAMAGSDNETSINIPPQNRMDTAAEIQMSNSLTDLEKAQMLTGLNKTGRINNVSKLVAGEQPSVPAVPEFKERKPKNPGRTVKDAADFARFKRPQEF